MISINLYFAVYLKDNLALPSNLYFELYLKDNLSWPCTVLPRIEAYACTSFSEIYAPASKRDWPQIGAGLYLVLFQAKPRDTEIIMYSCPFCHHGSWPRGTST